MFCGTKAKEPFEIAEVARSAGGVIDRGFAAKAPGSAKEKAEVQCAFQSGRSKQL
jgi:hypothetical protein